MGDSQSKHNAGKRGLEGSFSRSTHGRKTQAFSDASRGDGPVGKQPSDGVSAKERLSGLRRLWQEGVRYKREARPRRASVDSEPISTETNRFHQRGTSASSSSGDDLLPSADRKLAASTGRHYAEDDFEEDCEEFTYREVKLPDGCGSQSPLFKAYADSLGFMEEEVVAALARHPCQNEALRLIYVSCSPEPLPVEHSVEPNSEILAYVLPGTYLKVLEFTTFRTQTEYLLRLKTAEGWVTGASIKFMRMPHSPRLLSKATAGVPFSARSAARLRFSPPKGIVSFPHGGEDSGAPTSLKTCSRTSAGAQGNGYEAGAKGSRQTEDADPAACWGIVNACRVTRFCSFQTCLRQTKNQACYTRLSKFASISAMQRFGAALLDNTPDCATNAGTAQAHDISFIRTGESTELSDAIGPSDSLAGNTSLMDHPFLLFRVVARGAIPVRSMQLRVCTAQGWVTFDRSIEKVDECDIVYEQPVPYEIVADGYLVNVRASIEVEGPVRRTLPPASLVEVYERKVNSEGLMRLRLVDGWINERRKGADDAGLLFAVRGGDYRAAAFVKQMTATIVLLPALCSSDSRVRAAAATWVAANVARSAIASTALMDEVDETIVEEELNCCPCCYCRGISSRADEGEFRISLTRDSSSQRHRSGTVSEDRPAFCGELPSEKGMQALECTQSADLKPLPAGDVLLSHPLLSGGSPVAPASQLAAAAPQTSGVALFSVGEPAMAALEAADLQPAGTHDECHEGACHRGRCLRNRESVLCDPSRGVWWGAGQQDTKERDELWNTLNSLIKVCLTSVVRYLAVKLLIFAFNFYIENHKSNVSHSAMRRFPQAASVIGEDLSPMIVPCCHRTEGESSAKGRMSRCSALVAKQACDKDEGDSLTLNDEMRATGQPLSDFGLDTVDHDGRADTERARLRQSGPPCPHSFVVHCASSPELGKEMALTPDFTVRREVLSPTDKLYQFCVAAVYSSLAEQREAVGSQITYRPPVGAYVPPFSRQRSLLLKGPTQQSLLAACMAKQLGAKGKLPLVNMNRCSSFSFHEPLVIVEALNEYFLFHGCTEERAALIALSGFDFRRGGENGGKLFGVGTYFAPNASKADVYARPAELQARPAGQPTVKPATPPKPPAPVGTNVGAQQQPLGRAAAGLAALRGIHSYRLGLMRQNMVDSSANKNLLIAGSQPGGHPSHMGNANSTPVTPIYPAPSPWRQPMIPRNTRHRGGLLAVYAKHRHGNKRNKDAGDIGSPPSASKPAIPQQPPSNQMTNAKDGGFPKVRQGRAPGAASSNAATAVRCLLVARVCLGEVYKTLSTMPDARMPPNKPDPVSSKLAYDSIMAECRARGGVVDAVEFVVFERAQALPQFIVTYSHAPHCKLEEAAAR
ncbi:hypothetical protein ACSSS7_001146 [Eimeria intestinalis]